MMKTPFMPLLALAAFPFAAALLAPPPVHAALAATVGDPKNPGALAQAVQDAYKGGARRIVITPGVYTLPDVGHTAFALDGWKNAVLSAYGVTLIVTDLKQGHDVFDLRRCANVTLQGPTLSQSGLTSYQGRVVAMGQDDKGKAYCDWKPDAGYPVPPAGEAKFPGGDANVVDAKTRRLKLGVGDFYGAPMEALAGGAFRVHFGDAKENFGVGDWLVGRCGDAPFKVHLADSRDCTIKDVTMMRNGFANVREEDGGGNHILHCVWTLGPRPAGATEEPLVTNAADGLHSTGANPGPDIEDCVFRGILLDDCIAIHGGFTAIKAVNGAALTLGGSGGLAAGQPARISNEKGFFGEATVTALKDNGDRTWTATLDRDLGVPPGAKVSNPLRDGAGYKVIGCRLGNTRSRGILAKADGGLIKGNVIEGCGMSAVSLGPEYYWNEADYVHNVTVAGNALRENGRAGYGGAAILVHGDGARGNKNIVIQGNTMFSNYQGDVDVDWTDGVTLSGNVITGAPDWPAMIRPQSVVRLADSRAVTLLGNVVRHPDVYNPVLVSVGANVSDVQHNDPAGIRPAPASSDAAYGHDGSPADTNLVYVGRWDRGDVNVSHSNWGGAYLRATFTGTTIGFRGGATAGGPTVLVSVDGEPPHEVKALDARPLKDGIHTLILGSPGQNGEIDFKGLVLGAGARTLPTPARPLIEFIGDSITTGGGQTLPATVNYAWDSAEMLGADHTQIAFSARALTSGYGCAGDKAGLDTQYFRLKNFNHLTDAPPIPWDFSYTPRVVVINLGQNDQCGSEPEAVMTASYVGFVRKLRAKFPRAPVVALRPFGGPYEAAIRRAVETLNAAGDDRVQLMDTTGWLDKADFVDGIHPTEAGHQKVARRLAFLLKPLLGRG